MFVPKLNVPPVGAESVVADLLNIGAVNVEVPSEPLIAAALVVAVTSAVNADLFPL